MHITWEKTIITDGVRLIYYINTMEYQKLINLLGNDNWVERNNDSWEAKCTNNQTKFKSTMVKSGLYIYSDWYILVNGTIRIAGAGDNAATR